MQFYSNIFLFAKDKYLGYQESLSVGAIDMEAFPCHGVVRVHRGRQDPGILRDFLAMKFWGTPTFRRKFARTVVHF